MEASDQGKKPEKTFLIKFSSLPVARPTTWLGEMRKNAEEEEEIEPVTLQQDPTRGPMALYDGRNAKRGTGLPWSNRALNFKREQLSRDARMTNHIKYVLSFYG